MKNVGGRQGILLLEVLLSVAILAGSLVLVSVSLSTARRLTVKSQSLSAGALCLREILFRVWSSDEWEPGSRSGILSSGGKSWNWQLHATYDGPNAVAVKAEVAMEGLPGSPVLYADTLALRKETSPKMEVAGP